MKWLVLICFAVVVPSMAQRLCCQHNDTIVFQPTISCNDSTPLDLDCQSNITYLLDETEKETDKFEFTEGGALFLVNDTIEILPADYCSGFSYYNGSKMPHSVAIICDRSDYDVQDADISPFIFDFCKIVSTISFIMSIIVYTLLPEVRDLQGNCTLHFLINYSITYLIVNVLHYSRINACLSKAYVFYFFSLCSFVWLGIIIFNIWKTLALGITNYTRTFIAYLIFGYGTAVLVLLLILLIQHYPGNHLKPDFSEMNCWFREAEARWWYYYFPIAFIIIIATFLFLDSYRRIWQRNLNPITSSQETQTLCHHCCLCFKLYLIVGVTWSLDILSTNLVSSFTILFLITEILNSIQGILIFILLIATRRQVLKALFKCKPCGFGCFSTSWTVTNNVETKEQAPRVRYTAREAEVMYASMNR